MMNIREPRFAITTRDGRYVWYYPFEIYDDINTLNQAEASYVSQRLMNMGMTHTIHIISPNDPNYDK